MVRKKRDPFEHMSFQEQYDRLMSCARRYKSPQMKTIKRWIDDEFLRCKFKKIHKNTPKEDIELINRLVKYGYAIVNENNQLVLLSSILHMSFFQILD